MDRIQVFAFRGSKFLQNLQLEVDEDTFDIAVDLPLKKQYNVRCIFELANESPSYPGHILGKEIASVRCAEKVIDAETKLFFHPNDPLNHEIKLPFERQNYIIELRIFEDSPVHHYGVLDAVPIPTDILALYFTFSKKELSPNTATAIQKYFDGYSHLGFCLGALEYIKEVIYKEYGNKKLDLVEIFSNTEIINKLFEEQVIMIVWGINPYSYPIYSADNPDILKPLVGEEFDHEGIFKIREDIKELSLIPGHNLGDWPALLKEDWPKIRLKGRGVKTYLKPYSLRDPASEVVITSFVVFRSEGAINKSQPLLNVDLLYH